MTKRVREGKSESLHSNFDDFIGKSTSFGEGKAHLEILDSFKVIRSIFVL